MANLAVALQRAVARCREQGLPGHLASHTLACGDGWVASDVLCTSGPDDRPFEEAHAVDTIAVVLAGSFECRGAMGRALLTPGAVMLGWHGQCYECGHEHGQGDRCVSFSFAPGYLDRIASEAGLGGLRGGFRGVRLPPVASLSPFTAACAAGLTHPDAVDWEALTIGLAATVIGLDRGTAPASTLPPAATARVSRVVRRIDADADHDLPLDALAREAGLSPYHFLRTFERLTGLTPHQYLRRVRLRNAAVRLIATPERVVDVALGCGFGDVSNFNRAFRAEFGATPVEYRRRGRTGAST